MITEISPEAHKVLKKWAKAKLFVYVRPLSSLYVAPDKKHRLYWTVTVETRRAVAVPKGTKAVRECQLKNITVVDLCWLAGLLDGEGSFTRDASGKWAYPVVRVGMTDPDLIGRVISITGIGKIRETVHEEKKNIFTWKIGAQADTITLMCLLYPHMSIRRQGQIEKALQMSSDEISRREELYAGSWQTWRAEGYDISKLITGIDLGIPQSILRSPEKVKKAERKKAEKLIGGYTPKPSKSSKGKLPSASVKKHK